MSVWNRYSIWLPQQDISHFCNFCYGEDASSVEMLARLHRKYCGFGVHKVFCIFSVFLRFRVYALLSLSLLTWNFLRRNLNWISNLSSTMSLCTQQTWCSHQSRLYWSVCRVSFRLCSQGADSTNQTIKNTASGSLDKFRNCVRQSGNSKDTKITIEKKKQNKAWHSNGVDFVTLTGTVSTALHFIQYSFVLALQRTE